MNLIKLTILILILCSCSSSATKNTYTNSHVYQKRNEVRKNYLKTKEGGLSTNEINELLSQKVNHKRNLKMAVFKLNLEKTEIHEADMSTPERALLFKNVLTHSQYIKDISMIPSFMQPEKIDFKGLRDTAALMQADLLLVLTARNRFDYDYNLIEKNEVYTLSTIEAAIIDVKTGVFPYTAIATAKHIEKKNDNDFNNEEFKIRAIRKAEDKALVEVTKSISEYFN